MTLGWSGRIIPLMAAGNLSVQRSERGNEATLWLTGRLMKDRRTKNLVKRLKPGDLALVDHPDLDVTAARALMECKPCAVVNAQRFITGRYPNRGPLLLVEAGIPLLDGVGEMAFRAAREGRRAALTQRGLILEDENCFTGELLDLAIISRLMEAAQANLTRELDSFVRNTLDYLAREKNLLFDPIDLPPLRTQFVGKHVLIVVRGEGYKADLALLADYLRDVRPVLLAVDGGADALLEARLKPDLIVGDMDSVSDAALRCGAELVVHAYPEKDGRGAPGLQRLHELGLTGLVLPAAGTSEDVAMLLADELGARLIVAVGTHFSLEDFLDKGRQGMASTFLTRLRIGSKLVDAKGIARLWTDQRPRMRDVLLVLVTAVSPIAAVLLLSNQGRGWLRVISVWLRFNFHVR